MRKLILTCDQCGQRMQVPRSAIGRMGMCPTCGTTIKIRSTNTETTGAPKNSLLSGSRSSWWRGSGAQPTEDAKRKFGEAVDLYYTGRYAESLAIFDSLIQQFPGNPDIENGRLQCLNALRKGNRTYALDDKSGGGGGGVYASGDLDEKTIRRIVTDKMLRGESEAVQLQAADIAARLLGLYAKRPDPEAPAAAEEPASAEDDAPENGARANGSAPAEDEAEEAESRGIYEL